MEKIMLKNIGAWDRWIRLFAGAFILSLAFWGPRTPWGWMGVVLMVTAAFGHCPIYTMLGIRSCAKDQVKRI